MMNTHELPGQDALFRAMRAQATRTTRRADAEAGVSLAKRRAWYATPMLEEQYQQLTNLQLTLGSVFYDQLSAVNEPGRDLFQFFNVQSSTQAAERNEGVGGFGDVPAYTGALEYESFELLYLKTYTHIEYAKGMAVERKLIDDGLYGVINNRVAQFGLSFDRKRYKDAANVFNYAAATSYTDSFGKVISTVGSDGKALVASDHPLSPSSAATQSNAGTAALTYDNVIVAEQAMMALTDSKGNPVNVMPDTIVVPIGLRNTALNIAGIGKGEGGKPGTANNDLNTLGYRVVVSRYLTDTNNWFLVDSSLAPLALQWYDRVLPEYTVDPTSDFNLVSKFRGYMRYSLGFNNWTWIYGNIVA